MEIEQICSKVRKIIKEQINVDLKDNDLLLENGVDYIYLINIFFVL